jgi:predicted RNase H-like HicB family nuclease
MTHYIAIVEDAGPDRAIGIWFPDLPGCFSAGDTVEEAIFNAAEAITLYSEALEADGRALPQPRTLSALRGDPEVAADLVGHLIALIPTTEPVSVAAE